MRLVKRLAALALVQFFAVAAAPAGGIIVLGDSMTGGGAKGAAKVSNRWQAWPYKLGLPASKVRNLAVWGLVARLSICVSRPRAQNWVFASCDWTLIPAWG